MCKALGLQRSSYYYQAVVENALAVAIQKMVDLCGAENIGSSGKSGGDIQMIRDVQRRIKAANDNKLALYDQYCDGRLTREEYIGMRDAEDKVMEELNQELREAESNQAEPLSEMKEQFCGLDWNGTLTREVAEALIERVLVYDGGRLEIKWRFSSPISPEL